MWQAIIYSQVERRLTHKQSLEESIWGPLGSYGWKSMLGEHAIGRQPRLSCRLYPVDANNCYAQEDSFWQELVIPLCRLHKNTSGCFFIATQAPVERLSEV